jgi:hypothetical protein
MRRGGSWFRGGRGVCNAAEHQDSIVQCLSAHVFGEIYHERVEVPFSY